MIEKYNDLAREALSNGDKILSENYLQHADHFTRILNERESFKRERNLEDKSDERVQTIVLKIKYYDVMLTYLEDIVRQINNRSYQLKNIIDWQQMSG